MNTLFIFVDDIENETFQSLKLDENAEVIASLAHRTFKELRALQELSRTYIVLNSNMASFHRLNLPSFNEKKANLVIPYALEDEVTQDVTMLHFAFDKSFQNQDGYLVVVIERSRMQKLLDIFSENHIEFDIMTLDWFALDNDECIDSHHGLLIRSNQFNGVLNIGTEENFIKPLIDASSAYYRFLNSNSKMNISSAQFEEVMVESWIAKRLLGHKLIDLCQGNFRKNKRHAPTRRWYQYLATTVGMAVFLSFTLLMLKNHQLNTQIDSVDKKIAFIYKQFFPNATQVISPRFRIEQQIKMLNNADEHQFWQLLNLINSVFSKHQVIIQNLQFEDNIMRISLKIKNFEWLSKIERELIAQSLEVKQKKAAMNQNQVDAILEVTW